jgi:serine protease Do
MTRLAGAFAGLLAVAGFLLGLVVAGTRPPLPTTSLAAPLEDVRPLTIEASAAWAGGGERASNGGLVDFGAVAARVNRAVVNVDTASRATDERSQSRYMSSDATAPREGSGSGFIIDPAGFVLTNHHVIAGADRVSVTLSDGRTFRADVVGVDPAIDVALLRVHSRDPLPAAVLGNSDALRVGEWVCAIGNPLGVYVHSVTVGVVSFLGRKLFDPGLDAYIQTDAAISFGNSGGPLINALGEVVGITTAISAQAPNIGFAIPIGQAVDVLPQLREYGSVARGAIPATFRSVTPELRRALHLGPTAGAIVEDVTSDLPADHAALHPYDVVVRVDDHAVASDAALTRYVSTRLPGTLATLEVWRAGETHVLQVKLRDRPLPPAIQGRTPPDGDIRPVTETRDPLGVTVRDLDPAYARRLRIPDTVQGVVIVEIDPAGPGRLAQLRTENVILEINRRRVASEHEYRAIMAALPPGDPVALLVFDRHTHERSIAVVVPDPQP